MHAAQDLEVDLRRVAGLVPEPVARRQLALDCGDPAGPLGMGAGLVLERRLVPEVERRGDPDTVNARWPASRRQSRCGPTSPLSAPEPPGCTRRSRPRARAR